jgi:hypothetical protein
MPPKKEPFRQISIMCKTTSIEMDAEVIFDVDEFIAVIKPHLKIKNVQYVVLYSTAPDDCSKFINYAKRHRIKFHLYDGRDVNWHVKVTVMNTLLEFKTRLLEA